MINIFEFSINVFENIARFLFFTLYFGYRHKDWRRYIGFALAITAGTASITLLNSFTYYSGVIETVFFVLLYFLYALIFLKGETLTKLFISAFTYSALNCIALLGVIMSSIIFGIEKITNLEMLYPERIITVIVVQMIQIALLALLLRFKFDKTVKRNNLVLLTLISMVIDMSIVNIMNIFLANNKLGNALIFASLGIVAAAILIYYAFIKIKSEYKKDAEFAALSAKYENDKMYARNAKEFYDKTCGIRHDLENHLSTALSLIRSGKTDDAEEYIGDLLKNQIEPITGYIHTDNEVFNAVVNNKLSVCERFKIKPVLRIMNNSMDSLAADEIGVLFGNLFDNAIEAVKNSEEKSILLEVGRQGDYLSIFMSNSIAASVITENPALDTTKKEKQYHGYGTKNIRRIVESHNGIIEFFEENNRFCCDILI